MDFVSPIWLWGLAPWVVAAAWLMVSRPPDEAVPFVHLWKTDAPPPARRRGRRPPPLWIILMLAAMLCGVFAAARPRIINSPAATVSPPPRNVSIVRLAAREDEVMVGVRNDSPLTRATLRVNQFEREIELPPTGMSRNEFFPMSLPERIDAVLAADDDVADDNRAALVRTGSWPRLTVAEELPEPVGRMAAVYQRHRTPQPDAPVVQVLPLETKADGPAIFAAADGVSDTGTLTVEHHALTAHVNWESVTRVAPAQPPAGFTPLVRRGERVVLAVREQPRQIWLAAAAEPWAQQENFVVFWTDALDWLGGAQPQWIAPPKSLATAATVPASQPSRYELAGPLIIAALLLVLTGLFAAANRTIRGNWPASRSGN